MKTPKQDRETRLNELVETHNIALSLKRLNGAPYDGQRKRRRPVSRAVYGGQSEQCRPGWHSRCVRAALSTLFANEAFNATGGGGGVSQVTPETRLKLREIALARPKPSDETREKMSRAHKGKTYRLRTRNCRPRPPHSAETRLKLSLSHRGKRPPRSEATKAKIRAALIGRRVTWGDKISAGLRLGREHSSA